MEYRRLKYIYMYIQKEEEEQGKTARRVRNEDKIWVKKRRKTQHEVEISRIFEIIIIQKISKRTIRYVG